MFLSSLIEELCTKEENNKAGCTLTFGEQCILEETMLKSKNSFEVIITVNYFLIILLNNLPSQDKMERIIDKC